VLAHAVDPELVDHEAGGDGGLLDAVLVGGPGEREALSAAEYGAAFME
jgi:hypothetical protein